MQKNIISQNSNNINPINQTKSLISVTNRLLGKHTVVSNDDWMQRLWQWADENGIDDIADDFDLFCICNDEMRFAIISRNSNVLENVKYLEKLSGREFSVLYLKYWEQRTDFYIAQELGITLERVSQIFSSADKKLFFRGRVKNKLPRRVEELLACRKLCLRELNIYFLPVEIFNLFNIEHLLLAGLQIKYIPKDISKLTKLNILSIEECDLEELPTTFVKLECLGTLSVIRCVSFKKLPNNIEKMATLKDLYISNCRLEMTDEFNKLIETMRFNGCTVGVYGN